MACRVEQTVRAYLARYNAGDAEGIVALFAEEATVEDPVGTSPHMNKSGIRQFVTHAIRFGAQLTGPDPLIICADEAAFGFEAVVGSGEARRRFRVIDTMRFNEAGEIVQLRTYFNSSELDLRGAEP